MNRCVLALIGMFLVPGLSSAQQLGPLTPPPGETPLGDVGTYRVFYQSYGHDPVEMPASWSGHFDDATGISYVPHETMLGRDAMFLHSPWRVPPGSMWVDYLLQVPGTAPVTLSFGIAMRPDVAVPDRSDGVTFSCSIITASETKELMREHWAASTWRDHTFDLAPWTGQTITLRLQVEPGPANSASWDYSYFGSPRIAVGEGGGQEALLGTLLSTRAYKAVESADLRPAANRSGQGVTPSNLLPFDNTIRAANGNYEFLYTGDDCRVVYTYVPKTGALGDFTVQLDESPAFTPAAGGEITAAMIAQDGKEQRVRLREGQLIEANLSTDAQSLHAVWEYSLNGTPLRVEWEFGIQGKSLVIQARCDTPAVTELSLGNCSGAKLRRSLNVPYLAGSIDYLPEQNTFVGRYLDWTVSHSSRSPNGVATYDAKTDGTRNPLFECAYIAVSPAAAEVLPNIPHPASPYLDLLGPRIMLDIWGHHKGTYAGDAENLRTLKDNGVDYVAIISHVWQRYGYDVKLPDHLPPNPEFGGHEGMLEFAKAANECGYVWSLHENYIDIYPDAPSYDPSARVLNHDGSPSLAWFNAGTGVQSFGLKCTRALDFARQNAPLIHERYATNAGYLDVHTCVAPWHQLDHEAGQPMAAMALAKMKYDGELFAFMRETHKGPLFGEGANHFYWAGLVDGVEAQVAGGEHHTPFLDFDLLKLHPQMVNHGMGYYERWFALGYDHQWGVDSGTVEQVDKYRAQEVAYGHAGFIGNAQTANVQWIAKEHHMMHPIQRLANTAKVSAIHYEIDGHMVTASVALALGVRDRQRIRYDNGLTVWVNWRDEPWQVEGRILPQWGFLALGPDTEVCTILQDGNYADFAICPEFAFADARTSFNMPYAHTRKDITPSLHAFEYLGENRIRLTYAWAVNETLDRDYKCFVHFVKTEKDRSESILFQQDHAVPKPASQWTPGETILDGPYEVTVPEGPFESCDIVIGLFDSARVLLKGVNHSGDRVFIGRLEITRDGNRVAGVRLADFEEAARTIGTQSADFSTHMNASGASVDFGLVATDGSVKINRERGRLTVFPYPRDKEFGIALDLARLAPGARLDSARVVAIEAGTQKEMGAVPCAAGNGRLEFRTGTPGAGRYVVSW